MGNKFILDACCGGRMFWFNKHHPNTLYIDNRIEKKGCMPKSARNPGFEVKPDILMDFKELKFKDKSFKLVVFDPPHMKSITKRANYGLKYSALNKDTWKDDIKRGFDECWRVLEDYGVLIFKWNETSIKRKEILEVIKKEALFGHHLFNKTKTHWFCFMKIPKSSHKNDNANKEGGEK